MADTLTTNIAESVTELGVATIALMPQKAPLLNLVTVKHIPKGYDRLEIPRVASTSTVQTPTEGDELVVTSQFDLTSTTITPTSRALMVRVHERATYYSKDDVIALVSEELAQSQAQDIDTDLSAEFANFGLTDIGATTRNLRVADMRRARRALLEVTRANGGPAPMPIYLVVSPMQEEMLLADGGGQGLLGATSAGSEARPIPTTTFTGMSPWIPRGMSEDIVDNYFVGRWFGIPVFRDGYIVTGTPTASAFAGGMFAKKALWLAISKDWDMKTFEVPNWIGVIIRSVADYNSGVGAYTRWGVELLSNDTAP